ncbi:cysteine hydrolase family protein [Craterilacuibacter sp. RT1T]|uniref:cysteine hydrolase family protein n=1 Tax=Craterilacuibacter sp. RT1T TaxID=2942211 RepID=UPI0020C136FC|nr:cysteine hydrolase family protein [Craterilacuibacter sp. RT1T]MCL6263994.1 cysteine hydrolase [Craterilacuibacter sp. RT1T]
MRPKPNTALLIIDVQQGLIAGPPPATRAMSLIAVINAAISLARSRSMPVLFVQHDGPADSPLAPGSDTWQLHGALAREASDTIIHKTAADAFCQTSLKATLDALAVDALWIAGYASDFCVDSTVRSAAMQGYAVTVIADAHAGKDRPHIGGDALIEHCNWVWANLDVPGAPLRVLPLAELSDCIASGR